MMRILFAGGDRITAYRQRHGWRGLCWLARRHPKTLYQMVGGSIVGLLGGWRGVSHVMVSDGDAVVDYTFAGTRFFPAVQWRQYPGVAGSCFIWTNPRPSIRRFEGRLDADWAELLRTTAAYWLLWLSFGRIKLLTDCIDVARVCLADIGIDVPAHVWTPKQLRRVLERHGYPYLPLESPAPRHRHADQGT